MHWEWVTPRYVKGNTQVSPVLVTQELGILCWRLVVVRGEPRAREARDRM